MVWYRLENNQLGSGGSIVGVFGKKLDILSIPIDRQQKLDRTSNLGVCATDGTIRRLRYLR